MENTNSKNRETIKEYIMNAVAKFEGITSEQVELIIDLYAEEERTLDEIKSELDGYFASIEASIANISMKQTKPNKIYSINIDTQTKGIRLSSTQMDLITITEISSTNELLDFIANCKQLEYSEMEIQQFYKTKIQLAKRIVFDDYIKTLITPREIKKEPYAYLMKKLQDLNIEEEFRQEVIKIYKTGNVDEAINYITTKLNLDYSTILSNKFHKHTIDYDNVKNSSYEEFAELAKKITEFDYITITSGNYTSTMNNGTFDSYHVKRALEFCKKHDVQARYSSLLSQDSFKSFENKSLQEVKALLSTYIMSTIEFINAYNTDNKLTDGMPVVNSIVLFDELINQKKDKTSAVGYYNIWESIGISLEDIIDIFSPAIGNKPLGVEYVYNESYVETKEKRDVQLALAKRIKDISPELIDIFGTKMHISSDIQSSTIEKTFKELNEFSDETDIKLAITEFDIHIPQKTVEKLKKEQKSSEEIVAYANFQKLKQLNMISHIAKMIGVEFNELAYGTITDSMDLNTNGKDIDTLYSGLYGQQLSPKPVEEIVCVNQQVERPSNSMSVEGYLDILNSMLETQREIVPQEQSEKKSDEKKLVKKELVSTTQNDDAGYANFPQLLILTLIIIGLLYILLM